jgi:magnesium transporter
VLVDSAVYLKGERLDRPAVVEGALDACDREGFAWIGLYEPTVEEVAAVSRECGLHELLLEDVHKAHQRAKWEVYDDILFVVLKTARYVPPDQIDVGELQVIVGHGFVLTVRHGDPAPLGEVRRRLEGDPDLLAKGPIAVLYAIADHVVDEYSPVVTELERDIDEVEVEVFSASRDNQALRVYSLKRQVLELRRNIAPVGDVLDDLREPERAVVPDGLHHYFRDAADHAHRVLGRIEVLRELLSDALNANLAQVSVHQNDDMRKISAWAAIIAAPTLLAGIWGMNFAHMPELDGRWGYPSALLAMGAVAVGLYAYFRRGGWL